MRAAYPTLVVFTFVISASPAAAQPPAVPNIVESPGVKVLMGYTVPEFEQEMQLMTSFLGVNCGYCHLPRGNFASDSKPQKITARKMLAMTKGINDTFFPDFKPSAEESKLGKVTCFTCHQGNAKPKTTP